MCGLSLSSFSFRSRDNTKKKETAKEAVSECACVEYPLVPSFLSCLASLILNATVFVLFFLSFLLLLAWFGCGGSPLPPVFALVDPVTLSWVLPLFRLEHFFGPSFSALPESSPELKTAGPANQLKGLLHSRNANTHRQTHTKYAPAAAAPCTQTKQKTTTHTQPQQPRPSPPLSLPACLSTSLPTRLF